MTQTEVMRQAAILRAAVDMAKASKGALSKDQEEAILTDAIGAGLDLLTGLLVNVAAIRAALDAKVDDGK